MSDKSNVMQVSAILTMADWSEVVHDLSNGGIFSDLELRWISQKWYYRPLTACWVVPSLMTLIDNSTVFL